MSETRIAESDLSPEVRGYIAQLQEENRRLYEQLSSFSRMVEGMAQGVARELQAACVEVPEGVHSLDTPKRTDIVDEADDYRSCFWTSTCACGWESPEAYDYSLAEYYGRVHCGYFGAAFGMAVAQ